MIQVVAADGMTLEEYLGIVINFWRDTQAGVASEGEKTAAAHYIDAFQSVRVFAFGEVLPIEEEVCANKDDKTCVSPHQHQH